MHLNLQKRKKQIFDEIFRFTASQCHDCERTGCACKDSICAHVESVNIQRGVKIEHGSHKLRFIGCTGCMVPPHQRETCTLYLCDKAKQSSTFDKARYEKLLRISAKLEWRLMQINK